MECFQLDSQISQLRIHTELEHGRNRASTIQLPQSSSPVPNRAASDLPQRHTEFDKKSLDQERHSHQLTFQITSDSVVGE